MHVVQQTVNLVDLMPTALQPAGPRTACSGSRADLRHASQGKPWPGGNRAGRNPPNELLESLQPRQVRVLPAARRRGRPLEVHPRRGRNCTTWRATRRNARTSSGTKPRRPAAAGPPGGDARRDESQRRGKERAWWIPRPSSDWNRWATWAARSRGPNSTRIAKIQGLRPHRGAGSTKPRS